MIIGTIMAVFMLVVARHYNSILLLGCELRVDRLVISMSLTPTGYHKMHIMYVCCWLIAKIN